LTYKQLHTIQSKSSFAIVSSLSWAWFLLSPSWHFCHPRQGVDPL